MSRDEGQVKRDFMFEDGNRVRVLCLATSQSIGIFLSFPFQRNEAGPQLHQLSRICFILKPTDDLVLKLPDPFFKFGEFRRIDRNMNQPEAKL